MACNISNEQFFSEDLIASLKAQLKVHPAWRNNLKLSEIESTLQDTPYYTFILSESDQKEVYHLSFLERDDSVHHHQVRIVQNDDGEWGFMNGNARVYFIIDELIPYSIGCTTGTCRPCEL